jgi:glycosyltransferase involved in cell wall biosynthesis
MLVSVIVPVFNSESFITETMDSVIKQTWKHLEIIVVDDGSTDRSLYVLQQYRDPRIKVFKQNNKGACAARNLGLQYSSGNVVQFLDADDILAPDKIEHQVKRLLSFDDYNDKIIHSQWGRFYKSIDENIKWEPREAIRKDLNPADWLIADQMSNTHCWLVPRKLIELGGFWDESLERNQDGEFFSRLISNAQDVLFCSEAKVYYR